MFLWDLAFPRRCLVCGRLGSYVCGGCAGKLKPVATQDCLYCGKPSLWGLTHPACRRANGIDGKICLYYYDGAMKRIIAGIKYRLVRDAVPDLFYLIGRRALFLTEIVRGWGNPVLQPVPLSRQRTNERGFNQAAIISRIFSSLLPPATANLLVRKRDAPAQASLRDRRQRKGNVSGLFAVRKGSRVPERVILIDDVVTSGETVREAARILKKAGAEKVYAVSVAKG